MDRALGERAEAAGILLSYIGTDRQVHEATDAQVEAVLAAMGDAPPRAFEPAGQRLRACVRHRKMLGGQRSFGIWANLYTLRSARNLGVGDLTDLRALVRWAGRVGAAFVGINPLHAQRNQPPDVSPYNGISRIFRNPIYLDLEVVPEMASSVEAREELARQRAILDAPGADDRIDYAAVAAAQQPVLAVLARACGQGPRRAELEEFGKSDGGLVVDFATYVALTAEHGNDWRAWPVGLRDPRSDAVAEYRAAHAGEIERHVFAQFELERQLAAVADEARAAGMPLGIYQDVALGSSAASFDAWAFPPLFATGASLGAPPDAYAAKGQDWGIPPLHPQEIAADDFRYWRLVLRSAMRHSGALRLDHAMGLMRCFWVPVGSEATEGCYVRYPLRELLAVVAEESQRHQCLVIAEDLGTVPPEFAGLLARAHVLSSRVMLFERDHDGSFRAASRYSRRALVTANTHDHATLVGYWTERDLELRRELGLFEDDSAFEWARGERARDRERLLQRLRRSRSLGPDEPAAYPELAGAVHGFLARTPAPLVGISLDDLAGEADPINIPGVPQEVYASWSRRMARSVADLEADPAVARALEPIRQARGR